MVVAVDVGGDGRNVDVLANATRQHSRLAAAAAPAFSMIGVLAGPVAALRVLATEGRRGWRVASAPLAGTASFLAVYVLVHDRAAARTTLHIGPGLLAALQAPTAALIPAVFGATDPADRRQLGRALRDRDAGHRRMAPVSMHEAAGERGDAGGPCFDRRGICAQFCPRGGIGASPGDAAVSPVPNAWADLRGDSLAQTRFCAVNRGPELGMAVGVVVAVLLLISHDRELKGRAASCGFPINRRR